MSNLTKRLKEFEVPTNPDFDGQEVDAATISPGTVIVRALPVQSGHEASPHTGEGSKYSTSLGLTDCHAFQST
jgi:hypothetical protein